MFLSDKLRYSQTSNITKKNTTHLNNDHTNNPTLIIITLITRQLLPRRLCDEVERLTADHRSQVEHRLQDRIGDVTFWREEISRRHVTLEQDADKMKTLRERLRKAHHLYLQPLDVALRCIDIRQVS